MLGWPWAEPSRADLIPVEQARSVYAEADHPQADPDSMYVEAPDFGPFNRSAYASSDGGQGYQDIARATATQNTAIAADGIRGSVSTVALPSEYRGGTARATSTVDVTFDLSQEAYYTLSTPYVSSPTTAGHVEITLSGPQGVIAHFTNANFASGTLAPGRYRFQVVSASIQGEYWESNQGARFDLCIDTCGGPPFQSGPVYLLSGKFSSRRGRQDLPLVGGTPCPDLTLMSGPGAAHAPVPTTPPARTMTRPANAFGCIPAAARVAAPFGSRGTFKLPTNAIRQPVPGTVNWRSLQGGTPRIQVQTSLAFAAPKKAATLRASAWKKQPGRTAPDFTWCPGNPGCAKITEGSKHAIVKYSAGPNRFGGTLQMVISAGSNPSRLAIAVDLSMGPVGPVTFAPIAATGARPTGAGYAVKKTDPAVDGSGFAQHMSTSMGRITMGTGYLGPRPGTEVVNYGFPFTTGRVLVRRTGTEFGNPAVATTSAVGSDHSTSMGARQLSLVAGGIALSPLSVPLLAIAQVSLPEPGALAQQLAGVAALLAVGAWRARRRGL